jgi:6,7-dimethyl-8-ribityllumazine synthase
MSAERPERRDLDGSGLSIAIVCARFNEEITKALLDGAEATLRTHGVKDKFVQSFFVPGAFELPLAARRLASSGSDDVVIALGAVIRGETGHYELVATEAAAGIARAGYDAGIPVIFGVLATDTVEQAQRRAGGDLGNRGEDAAFAAIEMATLLREMPAPG